MTPGNFFGGAFFGGGFFGSIQPSLVQGGIKHLRAQFRGVEDEAEKLARRIREGTIPAPVAKPVPAKVDYAAESARLAVAIQRFRGEAEAHRAEIDRLKAAERTAKLDHQILLAEQAYQLAKVQEAVFLEEMEVLDVAYFAVTALGMP